MIESIFVNIVGKDQIQILEQSNTMCVQFHKNDSPGIKTAELFGSKIKKKLLLKNLEKIFFTFLEETVKISNSNILFAYLLFDL